MKMAAKVESELNQMEENLIEKEEIKELKPKEIKRKEISESDYINKMSAKLSNETNDIQAFNSIVQMLESKAYFMKKGEINWETISVNMKSFGYESSTYSDIKCRQNFYLWSKFYAKNFDALDGKLEPEVQQSFDYLKIVHTLDPTKLWKSSSRTHLGLKIISSNLNPFLSFVRKETKSFESCVSPKQHPNKYKEIEEPPKDWKVINRELRQKTKELKLIGNERRTYGCDDLNPNFKHLCDDLLRGINEYGLKNLSQIQKQIILPCIKGKDIVKESDKFADYLSYIIAILQIVDSSLDECQALILASNQELAQQIHGLILELGKYMNFKVHLCIGGTPVREDVRLLKDGIHIVVGTVGRICHMIKWKALSVDHLKIVVLEHAIHLVNLKSCFSEQKWIQVVIHQVFEIIKILNPKTQLFFSSNRITSEVTEVSNWLMRNPKYV